MNPISALIASTGLCGTRAFLPAFIAALMLRFGADIETVREASASLLGTGKVATWFTSDVCLITLGILAALEFAADRSQDARSILMEVDHWAKPVMGVVTLLGLLSAGDADFINKVVPHEAGLFTPILALSAGIGTHLVASARNAVHRALHDADSENATGIHTLVAWAEDAYAIFGMALIILFPIVVSVLIAACIGVIFLLQRRARAREESTKLPCTACRTLIYRSAIICPACRAVNPNICAVNWLGVATTTPTTAAEQPFHLRAKRRCPSCATRLIARTPDQACSACREPVFDSPATVQAYDAAIQDRLIPTLGICALLGLVPVLGLIAGVLFYRLHLVAPYRCYVPRARSIVIRWALRIVLFMLIVFQIIPVIGALTVPLMAFLNYLVYRRAFLALAGSIVSAPSSPTPFPATPRESLA